MQTASTQKLHDLVATIRAPERANPEEVRRHLDSLTKPPGSLGDLERAAVRLARIYGDPPPALLRRSVIVMAGDHGVAARGVSAYPASVTAEMCRTMAVGRAAVCAIARAVGARCVVVDIGVDADLSSTHGIESRKVRRGTRDLSSENALTREEVLAAIDVGVSIATDLQESTDIYALGEMGIGNTTAAAAITAALTGARPIDVVGNGTGIDARRLESKRRVVRDALHRTGKGSDPVDTLASVGGLEIAGLVGITLAAASFGRAVVTDGFIATAAALTACWIAPSTVDYLFASHLSPEPGHAIQLRALGLKPLLNLGLRLGEGTGAALALPLLEAAGAILREMATSDEAGVSGPHD